MSEVSIQPQVGPQRAFLASNADIAIYGGAAGSGKTYALLLEPLRNQDNGLFGAVIFRRTSPQILAEGGLWDESETIYPRAGAVGVRHGMEWRFGSGMTVRFAHMEHEKNRLDWQGTQIPLICFDELTLFTAKQFFFMLSRNRSMSGVPGYIRATCNPDPDSWVKRFISWWIDAETGFPIKERSGKLRWFCRAHDRFHWADSKAELKMRFGKEVLPKSVTFIPASVYDNKILLECDPAYLSNLDALPYVERMQLKEGNWNIRQSAGMMFKREWFEVLQAAPTNRVRAVRYWDRAATVPKEGTDPDWTAGVKMSILNTGAFVIEDILRIRGTPYTIQEAIRMTATQDGPAVSICLEQDPGQAGVAEIQHLIRFLAGFQVAAYPVHQKKEIRAQPASSQAEVKNLKLVAGDWNEDFLQEAVNFPGGGHDDMIDAMSGALNVLAASPWTRATTVAPAHVRLSLSRQRGRVLM